MTERNEAYNSIVTERITRDRIIEVLRELPVDATLDDAIEELVFLAKSVTPPYSHEIERGGRLI